MLDMHTSLKLSNLYVLGPICSLICQRRNRCKDQLITFPVSHGWLVMELESNPGSCFHRKHLHPLANIEHHTYHHVKSRNSAYIKHWLKDTHSREEHFLFSRHYFPPSQQFFSIVLLGRSFFFSSCPSFSQQRLPPIIPEKRVACIHVFTFFLTIQLHFSLKINFK